LAFKEVDEMEMKTPEEWGKIYGERLTEYEDFRSQLENLIKRLMHSNSIVASQITSRIKDRDSFVDKIKRKNYEDPLIQCTDLVGLRIIVYYLEDLNKISEIIEREFKIDFENSINKLDTLDPDRFGYLSVHYVISISETRSKETEWLQYTNFKSEIQIRTVLQHAWAEIEHKLLYKQTHEVPKDLRRKLSRLIALLELADEQFNDLLVETDKLGKLYINELEGAPMQAIEETQEALNDSKELNLKDVINDLPDIELNLLSLNAYLNLTKVDIKWMNEANDIISEIIKICIPNTVTIEMDVMKYIGTGGSIICISRLTGIKNIFELDKALMDVSDIGSSILKAFYSSYLEKELRQFAQGSLLRFFNSYDNLGILLLYSRRDVIKENPEIMEKIKCIDYEILHWLRTILNIPVKTRQIANALGGDSSKASPHKD